MLLPLSLHAAVAIILISHRLEVLTREILHALIGNFPHIKNLFCKQNYTDALRETFRYILYLDVDLANCIATLRDDYFGIIDRWRSASGLVEIGWRLFVRGLLSFRDL